MLVSIKRKLLDLKSGVKIFKSASLSAKNRDKGEIKLYKNSKFYVEQGATLDGEGCLSVGKYENKCLGYGDFVYLYKGSRLTIDGNFTVYEKGYVEVLPGGHLTFGQGFTNYGCRISCKNAITIGKKVATIAEAFGAKARYYSTSGANTNNEYVRVSLDSLLKTCDIISIHAPLNDKTANLIGEEELNKMKNGAILMNFGRGGIVDENALAKAIDEKNLKVALDVLEIEPMIENHPLLSVKNKENLIITPHIAWASNEARATLVELVAKNIKDFINGK